MRIRVLRVMVATAWIASPLAYLAGAPPIAAEETPTSDARESEETTRIVEAELPRWNMWSGPDRKRPLKLEPKSVLRWSNPATQHVYGDVFFWTLDGRPEVVMSLFKVWEPPRGLHAEMHSLSLTEVAAERNRTTLWHSTKPGVAPADVPDAPAPADTATRRSSQMRTLAKGFSCELVDLRVNEQGERQSLRLLPQPIYRYESSDPDVLDGAVFAVVLGTDPELFLLIEARRSQDGFRWQFGLARMNDDAMVVKHNDREVWRVEPLKRRDRLHDAYFLEGIPEVP
ncbi:MAG TPA: hypothetical protein VG125_10965 [Pirellulales bacterium]|nr:hypothetical protein [Pirellulales bacterium]